MLMEFKPTLSLISLQQRNVCWHF